MEGDIVQMGAYIGAGLACTGMGGAAIGVGHVVGNFLAGALRTHPLQRHKQPRCLSVSRLPKHWVFSHSSLLCC